MFLAGNRLFWIELLLQGKPRTRLGKAKQSFSADQLDQVNLDVVSVNHGIIIHENRNLAICGLGFPVTDERTADSGFPPRQEMRCTFRLAAT